MLTNQAGASMSFSFFGSSISIIGAKRPNHGNYHVQLDDQSFPQLSGSSSTDLMNQTLFNLQLGQAGSHKVTIFNDGADYLDIDYVSMWSVRLRYFDRQYLSRHTSVLRIPTIILVDLTTSLGDIFGKHRTVCDILLSFRRLITRSALSATEDTSATAGFTFEVRPNELGFT